MNNSTNFEIAFNFVRALFVKVISTLDNIRLFGDFSILDFNVALLILGAILPIVIVTVKNWSSTAHYDNFRERRHQDYVKAYKNSLNDRK